VVDARDDVVVDAHGEELQQALLNVVHNAVQACDVGGQVAICCRRDEESAVVEVGDTGAGFSPDALARAFSPFFTTKSDGTGLGLAIVRRVLDAHGGEVGVQNRPDGGARVSLRLPLSSSSSSRR